jgi:hypothetical protein
VLPKNFPLYLLIIVLEISFGCGNEIPLTQKGVSLLIFSRKVSCYFADCFPSQYTIRLSAVNSKLEYNPRILYDKSVLAYVFEKLNYFSSVETIGCLNFAFCLALTLSIGLTVILLINILMLKLNVIILKVYQNQL